MSNDRRMTKTQIAAHLAERFDIPKATAVAMIDEFSELAYSECERAGSFLIPGIGKLVVRDRAARMGRNPATGEPIEIPAKRVLAFRVTKAAKDAILEPGE